MCGARFKLVLRFLEFVDVTTPRQSVSLPRASCLRGRLRIKRVWNLHEPQPCRRRGGRRRGLTWVNQSPRHGAARLRKPSLVPSPPPPSLCPFGRSSLFSHGPPTRIHPFEPFPQLDYTHFLARLLPHIPDTQEQQRYCQQRAHISLIPRLWSSVYHSLQHALFHGDTFFLSLADVDTLSFWYSVYSGTRAFGKAKQLVQQLGLSEHPLSWSCILGLPLPPIEHYT